MTNLCKCTNITTYPNTLCNECKPKHTYIPRKGKEFKKTLEPHNASSSSSNRDNNNHNHIPKRVAPCIYKTCRHLAVEPNQ